MRPGCRVTVVPAETSAAEVATLKPDGLFLSNGPGDPGRGRLRASAPSASSPERGCPTFGICLGHQLVGLAFGGSTAKLPYGHRGGNHPVRDLATGQVLITTQNHGFAVVGDADGVPGAPALEVTHLNLNDGTIEGCATRASRCSPCSTTRRPRPDRTTPTPTSPNSWRSMPRASPAEPPTP